MNNIDSYNITPVNNDFDGDVKKCGDFRYLKEFRVENVTRPGVNLSGIIIQVVQKYSEVTDADGIKYNTTNAILNFTSGYVKYSCDSYFEIFNIDSNGRSTYADAFANGALARYDSKGRVFIYDPTDRQYQKYKTQGGIRMNGRSFFIPERGPYFHKVIEFPWNDNPATPANGLPFLAYNEGISNQLASYSQSNFLDHSVELVWSFDEQMPQYRSNFTCVPNPNNPPISNTCLILRLPGHLGHGGRKRKTKTKKNNKRKRRKTPRRH